MSASWTPSAPSLHVRAEGDGPLLLLLHEMGGSLASWDRVVEGLGGTFSVVRFDQRGAGWAEKPREPYCQRDLAQDALRALEANGAHGPAIVCAVASACATAAELAMIAPHVAERLVLLSPAFGVSGPAKAATIERAERTERLGMAAIVETAMERMYPAALRDEYYATYRSQFLACDPFAFAQGNRAFAMSDIDLTRIGARVILAPGDQDIRPVSASEDAARLLPDAEVVVIPSAGHLPHVQAPAAVAELLIGLSRT